MEVGTRRLCRRQCRCRYKLRLLAWKYQLPVWSLPAWAQSTRAQSASTQKRAFEFASWVTPHLSPRNATANFPLFTPFALAGTSYRWRWLISSSSWRAYRTRRKSTPSRRGNGASHYVNFPRPQRTSRSACQSSHWPRYRRSDTALLSTH